MAASVTATISSVSYDGKGREWEHVELSSGHSFSLGPPQEKRVPLCWAHRSLSCWGNLSFVERKAVSDAEPLDAAPGPAW